jgi:hypothetical protein
VAEVLALADFVNSSIREEPNFHLRRHTPVSVDVSQRPPTSEQALRAASRITRML